jgi:hypothetical protein
VYAKVGIRLPRTSEEQILDPAGKHIDRKSLLPGDLVFFRNAGGDVHHVGISLGGDKFIDAPHTGAKVRIDNLKDPYWAQEFAGGRRFDQAVSAHAAPVKHEVAAAAQPAVDERAVRLAQEALKQDAAQAQRPGTAIYEALVRQERGKNDQVQALPAVRRTA